MKEPTYRHSYHHSFHRMYKHGLLNWRLFLWQEEWLHNSKFTYTIENFQQRSPMKFWTWWNSGLRWICTTYKLSYTGLASLKKLSNLFSNLSIENSTHSIFLRHISLLERHSLPENILHWLWLNKLWNNETQILIPWMEDTNLEKLAVTAEKICENACTQNINAIQNPFSIQMDLIQQL